jgi:catechol 2,3-dioxygenase-like lactoylglutathione lyase family enzyme
MTRWYSRPVLFVSDVNRALHFYLGSLGFEKSWHEGNGSGKVCQVSRPGCEIILCEDPARQDRGRLFIELDKTGMAELSGELAEHAIPNKKFRWGYDCIRIEDPDGNELLFPFPDE